MNSNPSPWAREQVLHQTNQLFADALRGGKAMWIGREADRIVREHPESGMRAEELIYVMIEMAVNLRLSFDTTR